MAPRDASEGRNNTPDPVEKGFATLSTLRSVQHNSDSFFYIGRIQYLQVQLTNIYLGLVSRRLLKK